MLIHSVASTLLIHMDSALCVNNTVCIMSCTASSFAQSDGARAGWADAWAIEADD
jgi:hypothetical protein